RAPHHPDSFLIDYEKHGGVDGVAAGHRAAHETGHDIAAAGFGKRAIAIGKLGESRTGDAASGKTERRLFFERQRLGRVLAGIAQRSALELHAFGEAAGTALEEGVEERVGGHEGLCYITPKASARMTTSSDGIAAAPRLVLCVGGFVLQKVHF